MNKKFSSKDEVLHQFYKKKNNIQALLRNPKDLKITILYFQMEKSEYVLVRKFVKLVQRILNNYLHLLFSLKHFFFVFYKTLFLYTKRQICPLFWKNTFCYSTFSIFSLLHILSSKLLFFFRRNVRLAEAKDLAKRF